MVREYTVKYSICLTHRLRVMLKALLPSTGFTPKKRERIFGGLLYSMSCVEEVLVIGLLKKLLTFVETKDTGGYISELLMALTLRDTSMRRVVLNSLNNTKENSGIQRLTNNDSNYGSSSIAYFLVTPVNPSYVHSTICSLKGYKITG